MCTYLFFIFIATKYAFVGEGGLDTRGIYEITDFQSRINKYSLPSFLFLKDSTLLIILLDEKKNDNSSSENKR